MLFDQLRTCRGLKEEFDGPASTTDKGDLTIEVTNLSRRDFKVGRGIIASMLDPVCGARAHIGL